MKALIKPILIVLFLAFLGFSVWHLSQKIQEKKEISEQLEFLPQLSAYRMDSTLYDQSTLGDGSTVIIYFNSECAYCQHEVKSIEEHLSAFGQTNILFISSESIHTIHQFVQQFGFASSANVQFLKIEEDMVYPTFWAVSVPHLFIYSQDGKLLKEYKGETKIEAIIKYISTQ